MRSGPEIAACLLLLTGIAAPTASASEPLTPTEVTQAIETVRADPNLQTERAGRQLVWDDDGEPKKRASGSWWKWLTDLFGWIGQLSQMLMWLVIAALVAVLAVLVLRLFSRSRASENTRNPLAPTHVRDLDIRPESLPQDIGAAARKLWEAGEHRAALALLYRGLLSRLAHSFAIPIRDSSTEGDCLALATSVLDARRVAYVTRLVRTWQLAIYAARTIDDAVFFELCDEFGAQLPQEAGHANPPGTALASGASA